MGIWQGEDMDSLKYDEGLPCQTLYSHKFYVNRREVEMSTDFNSENTSLNIDLIQTIGISMQLEISIYRLISFWDEINQKIKIAVESRLRCMGAWQGVAMDFLKCY
jgi:hypothetical protein